MYHANNCDMIAINGDRVKEISSILYFVKEILSILYFNGNNFRDI